MDCILDNKDTQESRYGKCTLIKSAQSSIYRQQKHLKGCRDCAWSYESPRLLRPQGRSIPDRRNGGAKRWNGSGKYWVVQMTRPIADDDDEVIIDEDDDWEGWGVGGICDSESGDRPIIEFDIMMLAKPAKPKRSKVGDFVILPTVRRVVALDEEQEQQADESWEYVDDGDRWKAPKRSYAQVLKR
ncbi:hypothetical protein C8Q75DRAFT_733723 [Abortiporus biennis]|nr:hypothetical protein C8Q75DRAFT_733723 [Abortiporus biennis]